MLNLPNNCISTQFLWHTVVFSNNQFLVLQCLFNVTPIMSICRVFMWWKKKKNSEKQLDFPYLPIWYKQRVRIGFTEYTPEAKCFLSIFRYSIVYRKEEYFNNLITFNSASIMYIYWASFSFIIVFGSACDWWWEIYPLWQS